MSRNRTEHATLIYQPDHFNPEDLLHFIETDFFTDDWDDLKLPEEELGALQICIMCDPKQGDVIRGTKGLRKMRYAPSTWNKGKSGSLRVCYVHFERHHVVLLVVVYKKTDVDDLPESAVEAVNQEIERIAKALDKRLS